MSADPRTTPEPTDGDPIFDAAYAYLAPQMVRIVAREFARRIAILARENMARQEAAHD